MKQQTYEHVGRQTLGLAFVGGTLTNCAVITKGHDDAKQGACLNLPWSGKVK